jgi:hypothetical protein
MGEILPAPHPGNGSEDIKLGCFYVVFILSELGEYMRSALLTTPDY